MWLLLAKADECWQRRPPPPLPAEGERGAGHSGPPTLPALSLPAAAGLSLAKQAGLRQADVVEVVKLGAIACPMFALKVGGWAARQAARSARSGEVLTRRAGTAAACIICRPAACIICRHHLVPIPPQGPGMSEGSYPAAFPLKHQQKDLR